MRSVRSRSAGLIPWRPNAPVAQWIERAPPERKAVGSIPTGRISAASLRGNRMVERDRRDADVAESRKLRAPVGARNRRSEQRADRAARRGARPPRTGAARRDRDACARREHVGGLRVARPVPSEAAFAVLAGAAPIPVSSGQIVRYRLSRGGDRALNQALHSAVLT